MSEHQTLITKLEEKQAVIGIVGLGYVGLPLVLRFCSIGYPVIGIDIDGEKVSSLNGGHSYIEHISDDEVLDAKSKGFQATVAFEKVSECDALILCVPTPLSKHREPDLSYVINTVELLKPFIRSGQVISLESTTYPGTTEEEIQPRLESLGFEVGGDVFLVYSPEREDPGNADFKTNQIPKIVGGCTENCTLVGQTLYEQAIDKVVTVSSTRTAEMTKLLENIHRAVNIGLVNEMKIVADRMGVDIFEVVDAAATKPFGFTPYYPGPGLGGHCIPIDPFYLTWKAREFGVNTRFIELAGEVNASMPEWVISKLMDALNERGKALKGSKVLVLGVAYKKNVDDMRESPALKLMDILNSKGAEIAYSDPHVPNFPKLRKYNFNLKSEAINEMSLKRYDAVILATDHDDFDYSLIGAYAPLLIDTRGRFRDPAAHIIKA